MRRVKGIYNGRGVVLPKEVDLPVGTEVEVLIREPGEADLEELLDDLDKAGPARYKLTPEEVTALVHKVREDKRRRGGTEEVEHADQ